MTDDISAAKHYRQAIATVCEGFTLPDAARKVLETALWNPPTESATAPAEVGEDAISDALAAYLGHGGKFALWTSDQTEAMRAAMQVGCATLARQLAEAKAEIAAHAVIQHVQAAQPAVPSVPGIFSESVVDEVRHRVGCEDGLDITPAQVRSVMKHWRIAATPKDQPEGVGDEG